MAEEDLIFGKNRHFFGGMEPSNMRSFTVVMENGAIKITALLPDDTVIEKQTLCTVGGAIIRRKTKGYPKDEFDGDLVADIKASTEFIDTDAIVTRTYYYRAFPYSTRGVYNRNNVSKAVINEPEPMVEFTAKSNGTSVKLTIDMPDSAVGVIVRRGTSRYPIDETDGEKCMTVTADGEYTDSNVISGNTYYYSAFPYNSDNAYNYSEANRASVNVSDTWLFGYDLDTTDSDPATRVSYPEDVDNAFYTAAGMDYENDIFNYGSWNIAPGEKFMPRPCMLTSAGVVDHYLSPGDYTKKVDGTDSSVKSSAVDGNAMMEWPKIYTKRWEENGIYHFRCSNIKMDKDYECWCNYDKNDNEIKHFYTAIYLGYSRGEKIRSISGVSVSYNLSASKEFTYATANGTDWCTEVLADRLLIQDLLVMMAKNTNGQIAYGYGLTGASATKVSAGTMNTKGMFWGSNTQTSGVKVFGMEHWWGCASRRIAGWIVNSGTQKVKLTRGVKDGSLATDYNTSGSGYITVEDANVSGFKNGYITAMKTEPFGRIPKAIGGSSTTFEADLFMFQSSVSAAYPYVGGAVTDTLSAGPFYVDLHADYSFTNENVGATISCKPSAN